MRIACPNCDAEYEVDASAIPENGRDVQCSNCGHAWFQMSPEAEADLADEEVLHGALTTEPESVQAEVPDTATTSIRKLDDSALAVLREEAARESAARRAEAPQVIETQTELDLASVAKVVDPIVRHVARIKGIDPDAHRATPSKPQSRRDLLPEIEEINSTLRATSEKRSGEAAAITETMQPARRRGAFQSGFVLAVMLTAVGLMVYVMAPKLSQQIPGAGPALATYVSKVDTMRLWLDGTTQGLIGSIRALTGSAH